METVRFIGGHYDGAEFTFAERLPERIEFGVRCLNADANDPDVQEAIRENLSPAERDGLVVMRDARLLVEAYDLEEDHEQVPFYRWIDAKAHAVNPSLGVDNVRP